MTKKVFYFVVFWLLIFFLHSSELVINRIVFEGNRAFSDRTLRGIIHSREGFIVNRSTVNDDAQRIHNHYLNQGFHVFKVHTPEIVPISIRYAEVRFIIEEFDEPLVTNVVFVGNSYFSDSKIFELTYRREDMSFDLRELEHFIRDITELYLSRGLLFVEIQLLGIEHIDEQLTARIGIIEGAVVRAENFVFIGNDVTRQNVLITESRIQQNQIITPQVLRIAENRISRKSYILSCNVVPVNENTLLININEGRMTHLSAVMGYSTSGTNRFHGFLNADFLNIMGTDRNLGFSWRGFEGFNSVRLSYHESGPSTVSIAGNLRLYREERDSTSVLTEADVDVYYYYLTQKVGVSTGIEELFPGSRRPQLLDKQTVRKLGVFWEGNFTDDFINPRSGWDLRFHQQMLFVRRADDSLQRYRVDMSVSHYIPLNRTFVVANTVTGMQLQNRSLTFHDLIKVGGTYTIRGFFEDTFAGNTIVYTNTELRLLMTRQSRFFLFMDYGYVEDNRPDFNNRFTDLFGFGLGLRADSRIGLLRIDYGFHHAQGRWLNPMNGIVHFGIETSF